MSGSRPGHALTYGSWTATTAPCCEQVIPVWLRGGVPHVIGICKERPAEKCNLCPFDRALPVARPSSVSRTICCGMKSLIVRARTKSEGSSCGVIEQVFSQHLHAAFEMVGVLCQAVPADPGTGPEHGPGDPLTFEAVDARPHIIDIDPIASQ